MIKLRTLTPYFIMVFCPLIIYYFLLQEQSNDSHKNLIHKYQKSAYVPVKVKNKPKMKGNTKISRQRDMTEKFFEELTQKSLLHPQDIIQQLLVLDPFQQSAILTLKDETLSWLSNLNASQVEEVFHILQQKPSGEWQENLDGLQKLPIEELQAILSQGRLTQKAPKESLDQSPFNTL